MPLESIQMVMRTVARIHEKQDIPFLLIGGFAVNEYGYTRNTLDIDFMLSTANLPEVKRLMREAGFTNISQFENVTFCSLPDESLRVDLLPVDEQTMSRLLANAQTRTVNGVSLRLPSLPDLIALKIFSLNENMGRRRNKDLPDIAYLTLLNHLDLERDVLPLCERYGTPELAREIVAEVGRLRT